MLSFNEDKLIDFLLDSNNTQNDCIEKLKEYYDNGNTRHLYSNLTQHLLKQSSDSFEYLSDLLSNIIDDDSAWNDETEGKTRLSVAKLYDHIELENYRIQYSYDKNLEIQKYIAQTSKSFDFKLESQKNKLDSFVTNKEYEFEKQQKELNDFVNQQKEESKNQQKDLITHTLTVISIFTAVIFTALTGFNALTTIAAEIIAKNNMAIIFAVLFGTAIISVDIYYILLRFICVLLDKKGFRFGKYIRNMNFIGIAIIILILLISLSFPNYFII